MKLPTTMITCKDQTILFIWFAVVYTMQCVGMIVSSTDTDKINKVCPGYEGFCCADRCPWKELRGKHCQQQPRHFDMKHNERPPDRVHPVHALHCQRQLDGLGPRQRHQLHHQVDYHKKIKDKKRPGPRQRRQLQAMFIVQHGASRHRPIRVPPSCWPDYTNLRGDLVG